MLLPWTEVVAHEHNERNGELPARFVTREAAHYLLDLVFVLQSLTFIVFLTCFQGTHS
jgi:hypothetical protein